MEPSDDEQVSEEIAKHHGLSLWKTKQRLDIEKDLAEDRKIFGDTKKQHVESDIEKRRRIDALKAEKEDWQWTPLDNPDFSIGENKSKLQRLKIWLKKKSVGLKRRTEVNYIDCIHLSPSMNAVFLTGAFTDKYNQCYDADREYVKSYNKTKVVNVYLPNGERGKALLNFGMFDENVDLAAWDGDVGPRKELQEIEQSRDRLFIDDQTRVNIEMDDKQMRFLLLGMLISGALGFILSSALFIWLIFSGMV